MSQLDKHHVMSYQNLFVAKLPRNLTDNDLADIFVGHDPTSAKIMLDAATGRSKGFGFVLFDTGDKGQRAYDALNRSSVRSCSHNFTLAIYPSYHNGKAAAAPSTALYIRNIPLTMSCEHVQQFLGSFGALTYTAMREDHYGSPVWVVYAEYADIEDAKNALMMLHGSTGFFPGSAAILAKYEDTDDAKRDRKKRREGQAPARHVPSSGCIFPPPRPTEGDAGRTKAGRGTPPRRGSTAPADGGSPLLSAALAQTLSPVRQAGSPVQLDPASLAPRPTNNSTHMPSLPSPEYVYAQQFHHHQQQQPYPNAFPVDLASFGALTSPALMHQSYPLAPALSPQLMFSPPAMQFTFVTAPQHPQLFSPAQEQNSYGAAIHGSPNSPALPAAVSRCDSSFVSQGSQLPGGLSFRAFSGVSCHGGAQTNSVSTPVMMMDCSGQFVLVDDAINTASRPLGAGGLHMPPSYPTVKSFQ